MKKTIWILFVLLVLLTGCSKTAAPTPDDGGESDSGTAQAISDVDDVETASQPEAATADPLPYEGNETGNPELDAQVLALLEELYAPEASEEENLSAVYQWVCQEITYRAGTTDVSGGFTEEVIQQLALDGLSKRKGNCDTEAAVMAVLLDRLGYECRILQGQFQREDGQWVDHAWVQAEVDGEQLHFDPLYGRYYAEDPMDFFMQPDSALESTHQWDAAGAE